MAESATPEVALREVITADIAVFYEHQQDSEARHMAAFTGDVSDWPAYQAMWARLLADDNILFRTILVGGRVAGMIDRYTEDGTPHLGYWIGREFWGRGVATEALRQFLAFVPERPLYASCASDNLGSLRVLQKCGFVVTGSALAFAEARGQEIEEIFLRLDAPH